MTIPNDCLSTLTDTPRDWADFAITEDGVAALFDALLSGEQVDPAAVLAQVHTMALSEAQAHDQFMRS